MRLVAQYCDHHLKDGKFNVRFAVFNEKQPLPKTTVNVDATGCKSLAEIEAKAFEHFTHVEKGHSLKDLVDAACTEGRQVFHDPSAPPAAHAATSETDGDPDDDSTDLE